MRVVQMSDECLMKRGIHTTERLEKGKFYIMSDELFQMLQTLNPFLLGLEIPFREIYNKYNGENLNGKRLMALRHGGGGDILFMTTGLKYLKKMYPDVTLAAATGDMYLPLAMYEPEIAETYHVPISLDEWNMFHYHIIFEGIIEANTEAQQLNAYDLFLKEMCQDIKKVPVLDKIPSLTVGPEEKAAALEVMEKLSPGKLKVGIQAMTSTAIRNYPANYWVPIGKALVERGFSVFFYGSSPQEVAISNLVQTVGHGAFNAVNEDLGKSIALASFMDYFIAPDSMFIHVAGALRIPVIGVYGPFKSALRMHYFKDAVGIDSDVGCSPCFMHGQFPCWKGDPSPCFSTITYKTIIDVFDKLVENCEGARE